MMPAMSSRCCRPALAVAALAAALVLTACEGEVSIGGDTTLDSENLEQQLADQLAPQAGLEPSDVTVACPDDQEVAKGTKFDCTLTTPNGDEVAVNVTLTSDGGDFDATVPK